MCEKKKRKKRTSQIRTCNPSPLLSSDLAGVLTRFSLRTEVRKGHGRGEGTRERQRERERERGREGENKMEEWPGAGGWWMREGSLEEEEGVHGNASSAFCSAPMEEQLLISGWTWGEPRNKTPIWSGAPQVSRRNPGVSGITIPAPPPARLADHTSSQRLDGDCHPTKPDVTEPTKWTPTHCKMAWLCLRASLYVINIFL